ncbi:MAG: glutaredoxin family protein [Chloroflexi bacterium]|nr:glutaredoxin family protein [Chloroflexota bacterium]
MTVWPWQRRPSTPPARLVCYTRTGCCLCDRAVRPLARLTARGLATVEYVPIDGVPALEKAYGTRIPVVVLGGEVLAEGKVSELRLARRLQVAR